MDFKIETISLSGTESDPPKARARAGRRIIASLEQTHHHVPGYQRLSLFDNNVLKLERRGRRSGTTFYLDLGFIEPVPDRQLHVPINYMLVTLAALGAFALLAWREGFGLTQTIWELAALLSTVAASALAAGWMAWRRYARRALFRTRHGRAPLVALVENHPDKNEYQAFVAALGHGIEQALARLPADPQRFLAAELAEHRRAVEAEALSGEDYEAAKHRILACHTRPFMLQRKPRPESDPADAYELQSSA
ncbi:hypothetical protein HUS23_08920 [Ectothiorhodospiraceae bacterium 2226]|nr:hypothetical protein HUS23_08920 [Ectothiorhodospiraceae bacterium 2226]